MDKSSGQKADTLQAMFKHYADVGLDHQRQSEATSRILLVIAGAILTLIGIDGNLDSFGEAMGAAAVAIIGGFGMVWSWKQHETYKYWTNIAEVYQKALFDLVFGRRLEGEDGKDGDCERAEKPFTQEDRPGLVSELKRCAQAETAKEYGAFAVCKLRIRYLWVGVHGVVMLLGAALAVGILWRIEIYLAAIVAGLDLIAIMVWIVIVVLNFRGFRMKPEEECP